MLKFNIYDQIIDLAAVKAVCRERGTRLSYAKDEIFVQQGCAAGYLGVVESGYFKYTTLTSLGNEAVVGFAFVGEILADYYNSFNGLYYKSRNRHLGISNKNSGSEERFSRIV